jgi:hypothetical protein
MSVPSATAAGSHEIAVRITWSASASANGSGFLDSRHSSEWEIASTPVAAVTAGGSPVVSSGSRMAATGRTLGWPT